MLPRSKPVHMVPNLFEHGKYLPSLAQHLGGDAERVKYFLSGASGMLGSAICTALRESRGEVVQLVRRPPSAPGQLQWDPMAEQPVADSSMLAGMDAAIHLSGANVAARRWTPAYRREMWTSRVGSTRALCRLLVRLPRPPRSLVVASATGIYGDRGDEVLDEDSAPGTGFLAELCREWEEAARPAAEAGIRVTHLRFGVVLGGKGGALARMLPVFRLGLGGRLGSGRQWMSWIALEDLVAAVRFVLDTTALAGPVNLTAPEAVTNAGFTRALAAQLHRPAVMPVPAWGLRLALGQMADEALLASARVRPARLLAAGFRFARPGLEEALRAAIGERSG